MNLLGCSGDGNHGCGMVGDGIGFAGTGEDGMTIEWGRVGWK